MSWDDFDVGAFLGRGGFASVFRAIYRPTGATVALKVVDVGALTAAGVSLGRLAREVALQRACADARVVRCLGAFEVSGVACAHLIDESWDASASAERAYRCVVLEFCGGGDLRDLVRRDGPVAEREGCLLYTSPSPRDATLSRMPSSA